MSDLYIRPTTTATLQMLAEKTASVATRGKAIRIPSISVLLQRIADHPALPEIIAATLNNPPGAVTPTAAPAAVAVRPPKPVSETLAWIGINGLDISVYFPEKNEAFKDVVKALGYHWNSPRWSRQLTERSGSPAERAAELGHRLLADGFCVVIADPAIRGAAIRGEYAPEQRRWVLAIAKGEYAGWLALTWPYGENLFDRAMEITGAKYDKPHVVVPSDHFDQVEDFARLFGFQISEKAQAVIDAAKQFRANALVVEVPAPAKPTPYASGKTKLKAPQRVEIDEYLLDDGYGDEYAD